MLVPYFDVLCNHVAPRRTPAPGCIFECMQYAFGYVPLASHLEWVSAGDSISFCGFSHKFRKAPAVQWFWLCHVLAVLAALVWKVRRPCIRFRKTQLLEQPGADFPPTVCRTCLFDHDSMYVCVHMCIYIHCTFVRYACRDACLHYVFMFKTCC